MTKGVLQAVLDSLVVFFLPLTAYQFSNTVWAERGYADGLYVFGTTVYGALIMAMMMKVFNMTLVSDLYCGVYVCARAFTEVVSSRRGQNAENTKLYNLMNLRRVK